MISVILLAFWINGAQSQLIAFGSCYNYNDSTTPIFREIASHDPDIFIWLGDAAYVTVNKAPNMNERLIKQRFDMTLNHPDYQNLKKYTQIEGVWDDHDYNMPDGTANNPAKNMTRQLYLDFLGVSETDQRRVRDSGIYKSIEGEKYRIILLDVRWNRQANDVLGEDQWEWLIWHAQTDKLLIIGSGSQVLPDDRLFIDLWDQGSRQRLINILKGKNAIIISGDVHFAEILVDPCSGLVEATSSGLSDGSYYRNPITRNLFIFFAELFQPDSYSNSDRRFSGRNYGIINLHNKTISLYGDDNRYIEVSFKVQPVATCESLNRWQIFRYFDNFWLKCYRFLSQPLFYQLLVIAFYGIVILYQSCKYIKSLFL